MSKIAIVMLIYPRHKPINLAQHKVKLSYTGLISISPMTRYYTYFFRAHSPTTFQSENVLRAELNTNLNVSSF
jgi:hypothetical protein